VVNCGASGRFRASICDRPLRQFIAFLVVTMAWAALCRLILELDAVQPIAIGAVWLVGFVWLTGYIAAGRNSADLLTKRWLQMLAGIGVVAGFIVLALS